MIYTVYLLKFAMIISSFISLHLRLQTIYISNVTIMWGGLNFPGFFFWGGGANFHDIFQTVLQLDKTIYITSSYFRTLSTISRISYSIYNQLLTPLQVSILTQTNRGLFS